MFAGGVLFTTAGAAAGNPTESGDRVHHRGDGVADCSGRARVCSLEPKPSGTERVRNVRIMVSAVEAVFGMHWQIAQVQPWVDTVFDLFGTGRVMFGSHRPICGWRGISRARMSRIRR